MTYQSKKNPEITAALDFKQEKYNTVMMIYLTGPDAGKSFSITEATLKRWWKPVEQEAKQVEEPTVPKALQNVDWDKVNEPYPEPKEQKYVKKPQSVIEYEEKKLRNKHNSDLPEYEELSELLINKGIKLKKINSGYISLPDNSKIKRLSCGIGFLSSEKYWEALVKKGFKSKPCIEKGTPFRVDIKTKEEFDKFVEALKECEE